MSVPQQEFTKSTRPLLKPAVRALAALESRALAPRLRIIPNAEAAAVARWSLMSFSNEGRAARAPVDLKFSGGEEFSGLRPVAVAAGLVSCAEQENRDEGL